MVHSTVVICNYIAIAISTTIVVSCQQYFYFYMHHIHVHVFMDTDTWSCDTWHAEHEYMYALNMHELGHKLTCIMDV